MKRVIMIFSINVLVWVAFAQNSHLEKTKSSGVQPSIKVEQAITAAAIIDNYLALKDALVSDDSNTVASFGKELVSLFGKFDTSKVGNLQKDEVATIIKNATEHAKHIADNSANIAKQRQYFEFLTKGVKDLIVITGSDRQLYEAYCPMYNNNKGGAWLSLSKEISNPYFGSKMMKCGSLQQEISLKLN